MSRNVNPTHLLRDVGVHAVVGLPGVLRGVDVETSSGAEIPVLILPLDVTAT